MCKYVEKYGIIQLLRRSIDAMFELILMVIEKIVDDPMILVCIVIITALFTIVIKKRMRYVHSNLYIDKSFGAVSRIQNRKAGWAMLWLILLTDVIVKVSYIDERNINPVDMRQRYLVYYIPLLLFYIVNNIFVIHRKHKETYLKSILCIIPGMISHIALLFLVACANKSVLLLGIIMLVGVVGTIMSDLFLLYLTAAKDEKRITVIMKGGESYDIRYGDLIEGKEDATIRLRTNENIIEKVIIVKKEDIDKKIIYAKEKE